MVMGTVVSPRLRALGVIAPPVCPHDEIRSAPSPGLPPGLPLRLRSDQRPVLCGTGPGRPSPGRICLTARDARLSRTVRASERVGRDSRMVTGGATDPPVSSSAATSCGQCTPAKTRESAISSVIGTMNQAGRTPVRQRRRRLRPREAPGTTSRPSAGRERRRGCRADDRTTGALLVHDRLDHLTDHTADRRREGRKHRAGQDCRMPSACLPPARDEPDAEDQQPAVRPYFGEMPAPRVARRARSR